MGSNLEGGERETDGQLALILPHPTQIGSNDLRAGQKERKKGKRKGGNKAAEKKRHRTLGRPLFLLF